MAEPRLRYSVVRVLAQGAVAVQGDQILQVADLLLIVPAGVRFIHHDLVGHGLHHPGDGLGGDVAAGLVQNGPA